MVIMSILGIAIDHNIPGNDVSVRHFIKQETGIHDASTCSIHGNQGGLNEWVSVEEAELGSEAVNLQAEIESRKFRDGLEQWGEAEPVEREPVSSEVEIEREGVLRCGAARELTEELVGETGGWVGNVGKEGEGVVKSRRRRRRESATAKDEFQKEQV